MTPLTFVLDVFEKIGKFRSKPAPAPTPVTGPPLAPRVIIPPGSTPVYQYGTRGVATPLNPNQLVPVPRLVVIETNMKGVRIRDVHTGRLIPNPASPPPALPIAGTRPPGQVIIVQQAPTAPIANDYSKLINQIRGATRVNTGIGYASEIHFLLSDNPPNKVELFGIPLGDVPHATRIISGGVLAGELFAPGLGGGIVGATFSTFIYIGGALWREKKSLEPLPPDPQVVALIAQKQADVTTHARDPAP